jgi:hypothetical protein
LASRPARPNRERFASLVDQFQIEKTRVRSVWGVMTRVVAKLLAYMVGFVTNGARER